MKKFSILLVVLILTILTGCKYDFIVPEVTPPIDNGGTNGGGNGGSTDISFATAVEPIFNNGNNCTACHKTGGTNPDLATGKAYASINKPAYISLTTPESSKIYLYPSPTTSTHTHKKYTAAEAATILKWIQQGAKNN